MTAVRPSEGSPDGAQAAAGTADSGGSGAASTAAEEPPRPDARGAPGGGGGSAAIGGVQRFNRWSQQDSSDINTDDEGTSVRRLTPLERLNLDMCQDERCVRARLFVGTADL